MLGGAVAEAPFDRAAASYDAGFGSDPVARAWRRKVWAAIEARLTRPSLLIDVGAGTGIDAVHFSELGHTVIALEPSGGMRAEIERKAAGRLDIRIHDLDANDAGAWEELRRQAALDGKVDVVYADFGAVNCIDLELLARQADAVLSPAGSLVLVPMPRICPLELASLPWRGRAALRRLREGEALVDGLPLPLHYPTLAIIRRTLAPAFRVRRSSSLGLALPAPPRTLPAGLRSVLGIVDDVLGRVPPLSGWGDHLVVELDRA